MSTITAVHGTSTATRLLRLVLPAAPPPAHPLSHDHLMDESERRLCIAAHCGTPLEEMIANRVLDNAADFCRWESEHAALMRRIAIERHCEAQRGALLSASMSLIHRKALFEYLRDRRVRGRQRRQLMALFFRQRDYASAIVIEHGNYLRSAASLLCSSYVGRRLLLDEVFDQPLQQYEEIYTEYFRAYCDSVLLPASDPTVVFALPLARELKQQVNEWRSALQALAVSRSGTWRRPTFPQVD
jgi:hypothetical protein